MTRSISIIEAHELGCREVFITYPALGDQLLLLYAARIRHSLTGEKTFLGTTMPELFEHQDCCLVIEKLNALTVAAMFADLYGAGIRVFPLTYYQTGKTADRRLRFSLPQRHLLAEICARMALKGTITLDPVFELSRQEKEFGRFFAERQIAISSQGKERHKTWGAGKIQEVIRTLHGQYNFVQIGAASDAPLDYVLDKRGAFPLRQVAATLYNSDLFVGGIGALMHLARGVKCRGIITYSLAEPPGAVSYPCNSNLLAAEGCSACQENMINPDNEDEECLDNFSCIRGIKTAEVCSAIETAMREPGASLISERVTLAGQRQEPLTAMSARLFSLTQKKSLAKRRTERK